MSKYDKKTNKVNIITEKDTIEEIEETKKKSKSKRIIPLVLFSVGAVGAATMNVTNLSNGIETAYVFSNGEQSEKLSFYDQDGDAATFIKDELSYVKLSVDPLVKVKELYYLWSDKNIEIRDINQKASQDELIAAPTKNGNYNLYVLIVDEDGKKYLNVSNTLVIDDVNPTIEFKTPTGTYGTGSKVKVLASDNQSGISKSTYTWVKDGQAPGDINKVFTGTSISSPKNEGSYYLYVRVEDGGGNVTTKYNGPYTFETKVKSEEKEKVLTEAPKVDEETTTVKTAPVEEKKTDETSVPKSTVQTTPKKKESIVGSDDVVIIGENSNDSSLGVKGPTIKVVSKEEAQSGIFEMTHKMKLLANDTSIVKELKYEWTTEPVKPQKYSNTAKYAEQIETPAATGEYYLHAYAKNVLGGVTESSFGPYFVDGTKPSITLSDNSKEYDNNDIKKVVLSVADNESGVDFVSYSWSTEKSIPTAYTKVQPNNEIPLPKGGEQYLHVFAIDNSGNISRYTSELFKVDAIAPRVKLTSDGQNLYKQKHSITLSVSDPESGVDKVSYDWSESEDQLPSLTNEITTSNEIIHTPSGNGTYYLHVKASDKKGNETYTVSKPYKVDVVAPVLTVSKNSNVRYENDTEIFVQAEDEFSGVESIKYEWSPSQEQPSSYTHTLGVNGKVELPAVEGPYYLHVEGVDRAGNKTTWTSEKFLLDLIGPSVEIEQNVGLGEYVTAGETVVKFEDKVGSVSSSDYVWTNSAETPVHFEHHFESGDKLTVPSVTGVHYLHVKVVDDLGNEAITQYGPFKIDLTAPVITQSVESGSNYELSHRVKIDVEDEHTDVGTIEYKWERIGSTDNVPFTALSNSTVIETPQQTGEYVLHVKTVDVLGNEITKITGPYNVDLEIPTFTVQPNGSNDYDMSHDVVVDFEDIRAGVKVARYKWTESEEFPQTLTNEFSSGDVITTPYRTGEHFLHFEIIDKLGNRATYTTKGYLVDADAPDISLETEGNDTYALQHSTVLNVEDSSGVSSIKYTWSDSIEAPDEYTDLAQSGETIVTPGTTGSHYLHVWAIDRFGNVSTYASEKFNLDLDAPIAAFSPQNGTKYELAYAVTVNVADEHRNVDSIAYKWSDSDQLDSAPYVQIENGTELNAPATTGTHYLHLKVVDDLGNTNEIVRGGYNIDLTNPEYTISKIGSTGYDKGHDVVINYTDAHSGIKTARYVWTNSADEPAEYTTDFASGDTLRTPYVTGEHFLHFKLVDELGQTTTLSTDGFMVDADAPEIEVTQDGNEEYQQAHSTQINVHDDSGVQQIKYVWTDSTEAPSDYPTVIANNEVITTPNETGTHYLHIWSVDRFGNESTYISKLFNVDLDAPVVTLSAENGQTYQLEQKVLINVEDKHRSIEKIEYKWTDSRDIDGNNYIEIENDTTVEAPSITGEYFLHIRVVDDLGNEKTVVKGPYRVDLTDPEFTLSQNGNSNIATHHDILVNYADLHAGIKTAKYEWTLSADLPETFTNDLESGSTITTPALTERHYLHIELVDKLGNKTTHSTNAFEVDATKPVIEVSQEGNDTYAKEHNVTIFATDEHSSVATLKYVWTDSQDIPVAYTNSISSGETITTPVETGLRYLHIEAVDAVGNVETYTSNAFYIDNEAPIPQFTEDGNSNPQQRHSTIVKIKEPNSGLASAKYTWSNLTTTPTSFDNDFVSEEELEVPTVSGDWYLHLELIDNLGNSRKVVTDVFKLDVTAPVVEISKDGIEVYTNAPKTVVNASDVHSEIKEIQYEWTSEPNAPESYTNVAANGEELIAPLVTGNYYVHLKVIDEADNVTLLSSKVFNVDVDLPEATYSLYGDSTYKAEHVTSVDYSDALSDITSAKYSWTNSPTPPNTFNNEIVNGADIVTPNESGTWYLHIQIKERAGNVLTSSSEAFLVDVTAPVVTFSMNGNSNVNYVYKTTVTAIDPFSGLSELEYAWSTSTVEPSSYTSISSGQELTTPEPTAIYYLHIKATDALGNVNKTVSNLFNIDYNLDSDGDLVTDRIEVKYGLDPYNPDTDGDGVPDGKARITKTYTTSETKNTSSQTLNINLPSLVRVESVVTDTGRGLVGSTSGDDVILSLTNGSYVRSEVASGSYTPSDTKYVTGQSSSYYDSGGYSGSLSQYQTGGSYTPADSKTVSESGGSWGYGEQCGSLAYSGQPDSERISWKDISSGAPSSTRSYNNGGYSGTLSLSYSGGGSHATNGSLCGTTPMSKYTATGTYSGTVTKPAVDTRTYAYQGNVTKPAVDTRTYNYYYKYTVTVQYLEDIMPEH